MILACVDKLIEDLDSHGYVLSLDLAVPVHLMTKLGRPLLLEGDAGVGKTELAGALARALDTKLIRLQCYEGLDASAAIYEWNYQRQLLEIRLHQSELEAGREHQINLYDERFLLKRPLLQSISEEKPPVLLIDEIDRADEEFEAFLLEVLSEFQVSVPEFGTVTASCRPFVILTSNATRELSDALRRRCLYAFVPFPSPAREARILSKHVPELEEQLRAQIVQLMARLRKMELRKRPGIAEAIDWAEALLCLDVKSLKENEEIVEQTLTCLLKTKEDQLAVNARRMVNSLTA